MTCDSCEKPKGKLISAILSQKFGHYCNACLEPAKRQAHPGSAQYSRDRDREAHEFDLLQPWDAKGNPNTEFIRNYPEESKDMFDQKELEQYG